MILSNKDNNIETRTYSDWNGRGRSIGKGCKAVKFNDNGEAMFNIDQTCAYVNTSISSSKRRRGNGGNDYTGMYDGGSCGADSLHNLW